MQITRDAVSCDIMNLQFPRPRLLHRLLKYDLSVAELFNLQILDP